jgi:hypothetical protein
VNFGIFLVESLQLGHIARLFLVNVSENMQLFFPLNDYSIFYFSFTKIMKLLV